jgi:hypothetical protein
MNSRSILISLFAFVILSLQLHAEEYDIAIYFGTASGVIAAVQAKRIGKSVIIVDPDLGGLSTGGLVGTDSGKREVVGGLSALSRFIVSVI